jgi:hypothetical protein
LSPPASFFFFLDPFTVSSENSPFIQWQDCFVRDLKEVILFDEIAAGNTVVMMHDWSAEEGDVGKS